MTKCLTIFAAAVLIGGCATQKPRPAPPMSLSPTPDQLSTIRSEYHTAFPDARVGVVAAVDDAGKYALVSDMETKGLGVGQYVSFLDAAQTVIANGKIVLLDGGVTVRFEAGKRSPQIGDAVVRF